MASVKKKWLQRPRSFRSWRGATVGCRPLLWQIRSETPWLLVSLQTDLRERSKATHGDARRHSNGRSCHRNAAKSQCCRQVAGDQLPMATWQQGDLRAVPRALALLIRWPRKKPKPSSKVCELSSVAWGRFCLGRRSRAELAGYGGWGYMECSAFFPDTVQLVVDEALNAANSYYGPCPEIPASICAAPAQKISGCSGSCFLRMFQSRPTAQFRGASAGAARASATASARGATGKRSRAGQLLRCRGRWICNLAAKQGHVSVPVAVCTGGCLTRP